MDGQRLLLPFVSGVNVEAIDHALRFCKAAEFQLIVLAFICQPPEGKIRPEGIQQAVDFLETCAARAEIQGQSIERQQVMCQNVEASILDALSQFDCQGVLFPLQDDVPCFISLANLLGIQRQSEREIYLLRMERKEKKSLFHMFGHAHR